MVGASNHQDSAMTLLVWDFPDFEKGAEEPSQAPKTQGQRNHAGS
jgi:hypothetical protein